MVSSIGSGSSIGMFRPDPKELFNKVDTDGSGGISQVELKEFSDSMEKKTGMTLDVSDTSFAEYDADSDGTLSTTELDSLMESNRPTSQEDGMRGMGPPPSSDMSASSSTDSLDELISALKTLLESLSKSVGSFGEETSVISLKT